MFHFRKSASRGFEPTRDFGVLVTGFRQWWLPLRQRRGCGLRGAVRGELETDVGAPIPSILFSVSAFYAEPRVLVHYEPPKTVCKAPPASIFPPSMENGDGTRNNRGNYHTLLFHTQEDNSTWAPCARVFAKAVIGTFQCRQIDAHVGLKCFDLASFCSTLKRKGKR